MSMSMLDDNGPSTQRKQKRNKYSKFSKVDERSSQKDPWEQLIDESTEKLEQMKLEKALKRNEIKGSQAVKNRELVDEPRERNQMLFPNATHIDPYDPTTFGYIELGTILGPHGVNGMLKLAATTDFAAERICVRADDPPVMRHLKAKHRRSPRQVLLMRGKLQLNDNYIIQLEGIGTREAAANLQGSVLYAREEDQRPEMEEDEYIVSDLIGLEVYMEDDSNYEDDDNTSRADLFVGIVRGIVFEEEMTHTIGLGYDYLEIGLQSSSKGNDNEGESLVLIPFVPQMVPHVDIEEKWIRIDPPAGLLNLSYVRANKVRIKGFLPERSSYKSYLPSSSSY